MIRFFAAVAPLIIVAGVSQAQPITIPDPGLYLAQARCPDGSPGFLGCGCALAVPQLDTDQMCWRVADIGIYQVGESVMSPSRGRWFHTWSYYPWHYLHSHYGNGGQIIEVRDGIARITHTQDGSRPGVQDLGNYWVLFDQWTPRGQWRQLDAWNRARLETITFPASGHYGITELTAHTVVSEHYDLPDLGGKLERIYLGAGLGMYYWQAYVPPGTPIPDTNQKLRCPEIAFSGPPAEHPDWVLYDCRLRTTFVRWDCWFSVARYGWPHY